MSNEMTGEIREFKDLPKIKSAPKPKDPTVWSVYLDGTTLRARLHILGNFNVGWIDCKIENPENFVEVCLAWKSLKRE